MIKAVCALAVCGLLLAACGSSDDNATGTLTVSEVASATNEASSFRFSGELRVDELDATMPFTAEKAANDRASVSFEEPGLLAGSELVVADGQAFVRLPQIGATGAWCESEVDEWEDGPVVSPVDTLAMLEDDGRSLQRLGEQRIRDTDTVHYSVDDDPPMEIWVDDQDRLRRLEWTGDPGGTMDLYDFGAPIEITVPEDAPPCASLPEPTFPDPSNG